MQQLYLTGDGASASAAQLMNALNVPFSGFRLTPVRVGGSLRGEALHLLLPPPKPRLNDVLCRVRLTKKDWLLLPQVMEEIAAPGLCERSARARLSSSTGLNRKCWHVRRSATR